MLAVIPWRRGERKQLEGTDDLEDLAYDAHVGPWQKWGMGVVLPAIAITYGVASIAAARTTVFAPRARDAEVTGAPAVAIAIAYVAFGAMLHCHFFWGLNERLWRYSFLAKNVAAGVFAAAVLCGVFLLYR